MPKRITGTQRQTVLHMLAQGADRETIAASVDITPGQVSAVAAHVRMGTYQLPNEEVISQQTISQDEEQTKNLLRKLHDFGESPATQNQFSPILWGSMQKRAKKSFGILIRRADGR